MSTHFLDEVAGTDVNEDGLRVCELSGHVERVGERDEDRLVCRGDQPYVEDGERRGTDAPLFSALTSRTLAMQFVNLPCAALSCANEFVKCSSSCHAGCVQSTTGSGDAAAGAHALDLLADVGELRNGEVVHGDLVGRHRVQVKVKRGGFNCTLSLIWTTTTTCALFRLHSHMLHQVVGYVGKDRDRSKAKLEYYLSASSECVAVCQSGLGV